MKIDLHANFRGGSVVISAAVAGTGAAVESADLISVALKEFETDPAAAIRAVQLLFAEVDLDEIGNELDDLRSEFDRHNHGGPA